MPIGQADGYISAQDINLEAGNSYNASLSLDGARSGYVSSGVPRPQAVNNNMSGFGGLYGFWGATKASGYFNNAYCNSTTSLPSEMRVDYNGTWSISFFVKMANTTAPIANGYQPTMWSTGTTTFGQNTVQVFYEGKLGSGVYSNKMIARMTRAGYASGRRDYRWDMGTNGIFTNGRGWNATDYPNWYHMVFTYDGNGNSGAFQMYLNKNLMTVTQNNSTFDGTTSWTYSGNERAYVATQPFNFVVTQWYFSGFMWFPKVLSSTEVTTLYNVGAGVGANAVATDYHWWGFSTNTNDRVASYGIPVSYFNYNLSNVGGAGTLSYNPDVRPSY